MIKQEEIKQYLETLSLTHPNIVSSKLNKGDLVKKSFGGASYEIDDPEIYKKLGDFPEGAVPYGPINRKLSSLKDPIIHLFMKDSIVPFSKAYEMEIGECLEKSILVQLAAQGKKDSYLIRGCLGIDTDIGVGFHAYNIIFKDNAPFLIDCELPIAKGASGNITHPYIAPVLEIKEGEIIVPEEWKQNRTYSLS